MRTNKVTSLSIEPKLLEEAKRHVETIRPKTSFSAYIQQLIETDLSNNAVDESASKALSVLTQEVKRKPSKSAPKK